MFIMTSHIQVGNYIIKPMSVKYSKSVLSYTDTATIRLPRTVYLKNQAINTDDTTTRKRQAYVFNQGDSVHIALGYNGTNSLRFKGFLKSINSSDYLELDCQGYSYQLPKVFTKSYQHTTVQEILKDLTRDTPIQVHPLTPHIEVSYVKFNNALGTQVLEWLKKELYLTVYFEYDKLYAGLRYGLLTDTQQIKLRANYNIVNDRELKKRKTTQNVTIQLVDKDSKGEVKRVKSDQRKYSQTKQMKIKSGLADSLLKKIANDLQQQENYNGYQGKLVCFLEPAIQVSDAVAFEDRKFPERSASFFVEKVEGDFSSSGARQTVTLNYYGNRG